MTYMDTLTKLFSPLGIDWHLEFDSLNRLWTLHTVEGKDRSADTFEKIVSYAEAIAAEEQKHLEAMRRVVEPPIISAMAGALKTSSPHESVGNLFIAELDSLIAKYFTLIDPTPKLKVASLATYKEDGAVLVVIDAFEAKVKAR